MQYANQSIPQTSKSPVYMEGLMDRLESQLKFHEEMNGRLYNLASRLVQNQPSEPTGNKELVSSEMPPGILNTLNGKVEVLRRLNLELEQTVIKLENFF